MLVSKMKVIYKKTNQTIAEEELTFNKDGSVNHLPFTNIYELNDNFKVLIVPLSNEEKEKIMMVTGKQYPKLFTSILERC